MSLDSPSSFSSSSWIRSDRQRQGRETEEETRGHSVSVGLGEKAKKNLKSIYDPCKKQDHVCLFVSS